MIRRRRNEGRGQRIKSKVPDSAHPVMIIGGAGFIGSNLANRLLMEGEPVLIFDNLSRSGSRQNILWLTERFGDQVQVELGDILDAGKLAGPVGRAKVIYHFAAQVAVTTSIKDPLCDFESNLHGTLLLLEVMRCVKKAPPLVFTSTNKVYGPLDDIRLRRNGSRYEPVDISVCTAGIREDRPLKFHSPYGCSKGAADQYVLDYSRIYGLKTVVFRMSCIYGPRQFGTEDQGWVAHFLIQALRGQPITLYGDGMQVR
ncbi:MAG: NAD-dependent epimerase/dehydratase family protein, partial [Syntrophales bacterium]